MKATLNNCLWVMSSLELVDTKVVIAVTGLILVKNTIYTFHFKNNCNVGLCIVNVYVLYIEKEIFRSRVLARNFPKLSILKF